MGLTNYLVEKYGIGMVVDTLKSSYPPLLVFMDAIGTGSVPEAVSAWLSAHKDFVASLPPAAPSTVDWDRFSHRLLTERPAVKVFLDLFTALGIAQVAGVDFNTFLEDLVAYKAAQS